MADSPLHHTLYQRFPKWAIGLSRRAIKVACLINFLLRSYEPNITTFFYGRGVCNFFFFLQVWAIKIKRLGITALYSPNSVFIAF